MKHLFIAALIALCILPRTAKAEPISTALAVASAAAGAGAGFGATIAAFTQALTSTFFGKLVVGATLTLAGQLFRKKPKVRSQGIQTEQTTTGDTTPYKFVVGRMGLEGHAVTPAYSHGPSNRYLTYILEVSNKPVHGAMTRVAIDGQWSQIDLDPQNVDPDYGKPLVDLQVNGSDHGWIKFYDGTQTTADPMLVDKYGQHPDRPWTTDHILEGTAYCIITMELDREVYSGLPAVRFEVNGIALYDPRKDSTVPGGSGAHRWDDESTWEYTRNPQVINYNIYRGITLPTGDVYGGQVRAEDLPLDAWFAAMNECDELIGDRVKYEAGFEVDVSVEPADVIAEMNRASFAQISESGGVFKPRVGAPAAPVMSLTDDDLVITEPEQLDPFPGLNDTSNAITGTYVEPTDVYQGRSAEPIFNVEWEAEDGGRRLTMDMGLPAVTNRSQAQHLLNSYINDERRFRVHRMVLPPSYAALEPLDTIEWTSERNGYTAKAFEVVEVEDRTDTLLQFVTVRERDAADVAWSPEDDLPDVPSRGGLTPPDPTVPVITVAPLALPDGSGSDRRPGIRLTWDTTTAPEAQLLKYEVRVSGGTETVTSSTVDAEQGSAAIAADLLPGEDYQVRARFVLGRRADWSAWLPVTTPDVRLGATDLETSVVSDIDEALSRHDDALADATGTVGELLASVTAHLGSVGVDPAPGTPSVVQPVNGALIDRVLPLIPAQRDVEDRLDQASQQIGWALNTIQRTDQRMADAGIVVDPDSGQVKISAVEYLDQRASELSIDLDAAKASIELRATYAEVNQAIAEAQLDPADLAALTDLQARVSDAEIEIDALEGSITLKADSTTVNGIDTRLGTAETTIDSLESTITDKVDQSEFDAAEERLTTAETELSALDGASVRTTLQDTRRQFDELDALQFNTLGEAWRAFEGREALREGVAFTQSEMNAKVDEGLAAEASARQTLAVAQEATQAALETEQRVRADGDSALASDITSLDSRLTTAEGDVSGNATAISSLDTRVESNEGSITSQASDITSLQSDVGANTSSITDLSATKVDASGAVAAVETEINAEYNGLAAMASATAFAESTVDGITSGFVWSLGGDDVLSLVQVQDGATEPTTTARIKGDYIRLDGDVDVTGDFSVGTANIDTLAVTRDLLAPGVITEVKDRRITGVSYLVGVSGGQGTYSTTIAAPGEDSFGTIQGIVTAIIRGRGTSTSGPGGGTPFFGGYFRFRIEVDGATFTTVQGAIIDGEMQCRQSAWRGAGAAVTSTTFRVDVWDVPDGDVEILDIGFILAEIYK